ncbi:protein of unknown function (DUF1390) [Paramecium bursaria Chlorella virus Fr5L]|jgi:hypothetical protein|nr:protein of unknown function (DUF1390) [Paramecium bursaria Chlorella virus CZ-2]AGE53260.1 protein of unknown function (DUF1390) [Paramecium bursaria Chlorella virus Fr5L]AGE59158.1 protein of unknown function (DUF1390) [Paramecium bursaria Chlorella virus OR0704.2.2]
MKIYKTTLHLCGCGYETILSGNATKHKKVDCGHTMTSVSKEFVLKEDHLSAIKETSGNVSISGDNNVGIGTQHIDTQNNIDIGTQINITLQVPDKTVIASIQEAVKNDDCIEELRCADPHEIPAILFKYTRGTKAEQKVIKYDADKNVVRHVDPVTGKEVAKDLKRYRNEYLVKNADVYDDDYYIPYMPPRVQRSMKEMSTPSFDSGKKKEKQIPAADVIKMCASGDHRMYKFPVETKKFYTDVAENVDNEIKSTGKGE